MNKNFTGHRNKPVEFVHDLEISQALEGLLPVSPASHIPGLDCHIHPIKFNESHSLLSLNFGANRHKLPIEVTIVS